MHAFLIAMQFLTRLPVFIQVDYSKKNRVQSIFFYPLVGLLIGVLIYAVQLLLASVEPLLSAALILACWVMITGGLHLDGLADSADAWAGGLGDRQRSLDIMKDPCSGAIAVVVLVLYLLIKFTAILALLKSNHGEYLMIVPVYGRAAAVLLLISSTYARTNGLGSEASEEAPRIRTALMLTASMLVLLLWLNLLQWFLLLMVAVFIFYILRRLMIKRIGGITGDTAGAMIEIIELASLLSLGFILSP